MRSFVVVIALCLIALAFAQQQPQPAASSESGQPMHVSLNSTNTITTSDLFYPGLHFGAIERSHLSPRLQMLEIFKNKERYFADIYFGFVFTKTLQNFAKG